MTGLALGEERPARRGSPTGARAGSVAGPPAQPDVMEQLRKLGGLRAGGVLTDEEFGVKNAEPLGRL